MIVLKPIGDYFNLHIIITATHKIIQLKIVCPVNNIPCKLIIIMVELRQRPFVALPCAGDHKFPIESFKKITLDCLTTLAIINFWYASIVLRLSHCVGLNELLYPHVYVILIVAYEIENIVLYRRCVFNWIWYELMMNWFINIIQYSYEVFWK